MKVKLFENVLYEGDNCQMEYDRIKQELTDAAVRIDNAIKETAFKKEYESDKIYYDKLRSLNPQLYEDLELFRNAIGNGFTHYEFVEPGAMGIEFNVEVEGKSSYWSIGMLSVAISFELKSELRIEE